MTILNRLYASGGPEVLLHTLQIQIGVKNFWLTCGWDNVTATLETGSVVTFEACGIDLALPARNADGTQDLKFAISNIEGIVSTAIQDALADLKGATLTYRCYVPGALTAPSSMPYTLKVKSGYWTPTEVQITAGYMNILDTAWPRRRYNLNEFSGLRYIS